MLMPIEYGKPQHSERNRKIMRGVVRKLELYRRSHGLLHTEVAAEAGVNRKTFQNYVLGRDAPTDLTVLHIVAAMVRVRDRLELQAAGMGESA